MSPEESGSYSSARNEPPSMLCTPDYDNAAWLICAALFTIRNPTKKEFVMDLKQTYEGFLADPKAGDSPSKKRTQILKQLRFTSSTHEKHARNLETTYDQWLDLNASTLRDGVRQRFLKKLQTCEHPAAKLNAKEKEFKRHYNRGRRSHVACCMNHL